MHGIRAHAYVEYEAGTLDFLSFKTYFSGSHTVRTDQSISMVDGSQRMFQRKEMYVGGVIDYWTKIGVWPSKNALFGPHNAKSALNKNRE
jgi:hypothetical protein